MIAWDMKDLPRVGHERPSSSDMKGLENKELKWLRLENKELKRLRLENKELKWLRRRGPGRPATSLHCATPSK